MPIIGVENICAQRAVDLRRQLRR